MTTAAKFEVIHNATCRDNNLLSISKMCELAEVSRSGYYEWIAAKSVRESKENRDRSDFDLILEAFKFRGYAKGARGIYMRLLHTDVVMNLKKIRRLMSKYGLKCPYRGPNPYKQMARAMKTNTVFPNKINRNFLEGGMRKVLLPIMLCLIMLCGCGKNLLRYGRRQIRFLYR